MTPSYSNNSSLIKIIRKEVIQPHLPVRLPCYDLAPVTSLTLGLHKEALQVLPAPIA